MLRAASFPADAIHGFSTRRGGVSRGRFSSLNLGGRWGDDPAHVAENLRRLAQAGGFTTERLVRARQVHGAHVAAAVEVAAAGGAVEADGLWQHREQGAELVLGVMTADCVPVLLIDGQRRVAAAVHSGWRGTVAGIVPRAVATLVAAGPVAATELFAAIGPCIEVGAFEVGEEVAERFEARFVDRRGYRRPHVDLVACVRAQLEAAGVPANQIERVGGCTHAQVDRFFSYRRDGRGIGQQLSFLGLGGEPVGLDESPRPAATRPPACRAEPCRTAFPWSR